MTSTFWGQLMSQVTWPLDHTLTWLLRHCVKHLAKHIPTENALITFLCFSGKMGVTAFCQFMHIALSRHVIWALNSHNRFTGLVTAVCRPSHCKCIRVVKILGKIGGRVVRFSPERTHSYFLGAKQPCKISSKLNNKKLSYRLENRASATYFFVAKLISIAHSCL